MSELPLNQVLCGDCREVMKDFPDNSIDLVVTDPPYGLNFMGKAWDKTLPPKEAFAEIERILKPGAIAFINSSPRQDLFWRMLQMLDSVGLMLDVSFIDWIYKTGFPKAYDVSKGIDRKLGLDRKVVAPYPAMKGQKYKWGKKGIYGEGNNPQEMVLTESTSDLGKEWEGWKSLTGLKPAHEPIIFSYKPLSESTIVDNVLRWGVGAINVDACRIPFQSENDKGNPNRFVGFKGEGRQTYNAANYDESLVGQLIDHSKGRFPANLLVSDKAIDTGKLSKSGDLLPHHNLGKDEEGYMNRNIYGKLKRQKEDYLGDVGDQSRYFDLDAWAKHHGFLDVPKPDNKERDFGLKGFKKQVVEFGDERPSGLSYERRDGRQTQPRRNTHPTVKPIKLMAYLIELGCPPNGVVLDPFMGSGTTCIAAKQLVRKFIGIEINPEYHEIARARVEAHPVPLSWFDGSQTQIVKSTNNSTEDSN